MARDYVKKRSTKRRSQAPGQLFVILSSFLIGYLTATMFDMASLTTWITRQIAQHRQPTATPPTPVVAKKKEAPKPRFEFYTMLAKDSNGHSPVQSVPAQAPSMTLNVTKTNAPIAPATPASVTTGAAAKETYLLQIASFSKSSDADHLKASLLMRGFDVTVSPTMHGTVTWYRVIAGPFSTRVDAEKAQIVVAQTERMKGMIRRG